MKLRTFVAAALGAALLAGLTACAPDAPPAVPQAPSTVDQEATEFGTQVCSPFGATRDRPRAGVGFMAGRTGELDRVSLVLTSDEPVTVQIQETDALGWGGGYPNGTVLASGTFPGGHDNSAFTEIELTTPAHVDSGKRYAIVLSSPTSACLWYADKWDSFRAHLLVELTPGQWVFPANWDNSVPYALYRTWVRTLDGLDSEVPSAPGLGCLTLRGDTSIGTNFTAGRSGQLYQVSAVVGPLPGDPDIPFTMTIETTGPNGAPSGTVIGSAVYSGPQATDGSTWVDVTLPTPVDVTEGTTYAVVFHAADWKCVFVDHSRVPATGFWGDDGLGGWASMTHGSVPLRIFVR